MNFDDPTVRDGYQLHHQVPPQRWCVTRADLVQFKNLVRTWVVEGRVLPGDRDMFDRLDDRIGPCIHTVNQQVIKPVTEKAGRVSWALMLHPDGLECHIFVTHCWQEGIYEFVDKVLHSWLRGANTAYCCMLSNPQNLDIADLISSPRESPFAKALSSSAYMLVVPNERTSIYSRVWCVYEAFLAVSEGKLIFTATAPAPTVPRQVSFVLVVSFILLVALLPLVAQLEIDQFGHHAESVEPVKACIGISCFAYLVSNALLRSSRASRAMSYLGACWVSVLLSLQGYPAAVMLSENGLVGNFTSLHLVTAFVGVGCWIGAGAWEADRIWRARNKKEAIELRHLFTGRLRDAQSSVPEDKARITEELSQSGAEQDVDTAIKVLLDSGASTPTLRTAVARVGKLEQAGYYKLSILIYCWTAWIYVNLKHIAFRIECQWVRDNLGLCQRDGTASGCTAESTSMVCILANTSCADHMKTVEDPIVWVSCFGLLEAMLWLLFFFSLRRDKRGFAASALGKCVGSGFTILLAVELVNNRGALGGTDPICSGLLNLAIAPVVLFISAAGPGLTSQIPFIGPLLVQALMSQTLSHCHPVRAPSSGRAAGDAEVSGANNDADAEVRSDSNAGGTEVSGAKSNIPARTYSISL